jgi:hypothetical protein
MSEIITQPPFHAITLKADGGRLRELVTQAQVFISNDISRLFNIPTKSEEVQAIWDTGATNTVISKKLTSQLGLIPTGKTTCNAVNQRYEADTYIVDIGLPNGLMIKAVQVTAADNLVDYDLLIGMDIITLGDMAITNFNGITWFSFRFPPDPIKIDYVERSNEIMKKKSRRERNKRKAKHR